MTSAFFITGTDTGVGKTLAAVALLEKARASGLTTAAVKPVAAGCERQQAGLRNGDALDLQRAISLALSYEQVNPVALAPPVAPHIAAREAGVSVTAAGLADHCRHIQGLGVDLMLVEGAGGWRVPLNDDETLADLARLLGLPVILVVGVRLGCINHALLTAEAIRADGLALAGWIANAVDPAMSRYPDNVATLAQRLPCPLLGEIPFMDTPSGARAADALALPLLSPGQVR